MTLKAFNELNPKEAMEALRKCCGATQWANQMVQARPFQDKKHMAAQATEFWQNCGFDDCLEAFAQHPKIGDIDSLKAKYADTKAWAGQEQGGVSNAGLETLTALAEGNAAYEDKFGFIFIVCATGKSATEMLSLLNHRLQNDSEKEFENAKSEQNKITLIRINKLLS